MKPRLTVVANNPVERTPPEVCDLLPAKDGPIFEAFTTHAITQFPRWKDESADPAMTAAIRCLALYICWGRWCREHGYADQEAPDLDAVEQRILEANAGRAKRPALRLVIRRESRP